jgi:hypothetical protein
MEYPVNAVFFRSRNEKPGTVLQTATGLKTLRAMSCIPLPRKIF